MSVSGLLSDSGWAVLMGRPGLRAHCHIYSLSSIAGLARGSFSEEIRGVRVAVLVVIQGDQCALPRRSICKGKAVPGGLGSTWQPPRLEHNTVATRTCASGSPVGFKGTCPPRQL